MLGPNVPVMIVGGDGAYVGRQATVRGSLRLNVGGQSHVLGWFLQQGWMSSKTGLEILWHEKNLMPLNGDVKSEHYERSQELGLVV